MDSSRLNSLTPTERIKLLEDLVEAQRHALSQLEIERDALRLILEGRREEPPTLRLHQRFAELLPTTGEGAERTTKRLESIGEIIRRRSSK